MGNLSSATFVAFLCRDVVMQARVSLTRSDTEGIREIREIGHILR